jgi:hypothetical protein
MRRAMPTHKYRVKSVHEPHERVVRESELSDVPT